MFRLLKCNPILQTTWLISHNEDVKPAMLKRHILTHQYFRPLPYVLAVMSFVSSLALTKLDSNGHWRWVGFALYCLSIGSVFSFLPAIVWRFVKPHLQELHLLKRWRWIVLVLWLAAMSRVWWLTTYPLVSVGDEVREVGLYAQQIAEGTRRSLFDYGAYQAYSLTISAVAALFYFVFGASVLTYRLQAALLGVIDVGLVMAIVWQSTRNKRMAGLAGLVLTTLPLHLYYSRTEVVVMCSSTAAALLYLGWLHVRHRLAQTKMLVMYSTLLGISLGLYAAVRTVGLLFLALVGWQIIRSTWKSSVSYRTRLVTMLSKMAILGLFVLVGFGPRLLYTTPAIFFHTSRLPLAHETQPTVLEKTVEIATNYQRSLAVWFSRPTTSWYADHRPIVWPMLGICLLVGIGWVIVNRKTGLMELLGVGFVLHLTNSAITDMVNADHRLAPLYILGSVLIGIGLGWLSALPKQRGLRYGITGLIVAVLLAQGASFFLYVPANKNKTSADYLSMHILYTLRQTNTQFEQVTITTTPAIYEKLNTIHYREQYDYFLKGAQMRATTSAELSNQEVIVSTVPKLASAPAVAYIPCSRLTCPANQQDPITILLR